MASVDPGSKLKKRLLVGICIVSACLMLVEIAFARRIHTAPLTIWQLELLVLPWVFFVGSYLGLVSTSWFDSEAGATMMRRALSLVGTAGVLGVVTVIYFGLVY